MKTIETNNRKIIAGQLEKAARSFMIDKGVMFYKWEGEVICRSVEELSEQCQLIGTITPENGIWTFDFDPEPFVEGFIRRIEVSVRHSGYLDRPAFHNYLSKDQFKDGYTEATDSFLSLLQSNGIKVVNEYGSNCPTVSSIGGESGWDQEELERAERSIRKEVGNKNKWQAAQDEIIKNKIVIIEVKL